jgi:hypothetical protein
MTLLAIKIKGADQKRIAENIYSRLPSIIQRIVSIDAAVADVIENYVSLQVMTSWLWKTDQQKADAKVQASVDNLSNTINEVSEELSPSDPTPTHIRRFQAAQTVPTIDPLESTEDESLLINDVAAFTGIRRSQFDSLQKKLQIKKHV